MAYEINYEDKRFQDVEAQKQEALTKNEQTYAGMIGQSDKFYQDQIDAVRDYEQTQTKLQQEQTDFTIEQIEQQKEQTKKDYMKEQSGAYTDWQKQSNQYGANAEQMAASGLTNTGYSESSQVSMYNTYQNRVATARESYQNAVRDYDNAITQARLQNNSVLAEIAYNSLQSRLELSLQGFQYKNQLILDQASKELEIDNTYYGRYQDVLNQINTENALAEQIRQYDTSLAEQKRQFDVNLAEEQRQFNANLAEEQRQYNQTYALKQQEKAATPNIQKDGEKTENDNWFASDFYEGYKNSDVEIYDAFKNGYQPKGISGHGKLTKTGDIIDVKAYTLSGEEKVIPQNVWKAEDGTFWLWSGTQNKYVPCEGDYGKKKSGNTGTSKSESTKDKKTSSNDNYPAIVKAGNFEEQSDKYLKKYYGNMWK